MELIASAASARQILAHMDGLGVDVRTLNVGYVDPALQRSSAPVRVSARLSLTCWRLQRVISTNRTLGCAMAYG
jgi:type IV pilus biogenesis protein CpaD/CtpE